MRAYVQLMKFDFKLYMRDWITIFWLLIYPALMLVVFGSMFGEAPGPLPGTRYIDIYVPALCVLNVISVSVFTLNINMVTLRESGVLRRFRATPIRASAVLTSHAAQGLFLVLAGAAEIILLGKLIWNIDISIMSMLTLLAVLLFGCIGFFGLGFALSGLTRSAGAASGLAMVIFFPSLFLSGIALPIDILPQVMRFLSNFFPVTYFVRMAQGVWLGVPLSRYTDALAVLLGFAVVCVILALLLFRWEKRG